MSEIWIFVKAKDEDGIIETICVKEKDLFHFFNWAKERYQDMSWEYFEEGDDCCEWVYSIRERGLIDSHRNCNGEPKNE